METNSTDNNTDDKRDDYRIDWNISVYLAIVLCSVALLVNVITLAAFRKIRTKLSPRLLLAVNLLLSDVFVAIFILLKHVVPYFTPKEKLQNVHIYINAMVNAPSFNCTNLFLVAIALDHYIAITRPLQYVGIITRRKIIISAPFIWMLSVLIDLIGPIIWSVNYLIDKKYENKESNTTGNLIMEYIQWTSYVYIAITILSFIFITALYIRMHQITRKTLHSLPMELASMTSFLHIQPSASLPIAKRYTTLAVLLFVTFAFFSMPGVIMRMVKHIYENNITPTAYLLFLYAQVIRVLTSIAHPIVYCVQMTSVNQAIKDLFSGKKSPVPAPDPSHMSK